MKLDLQNRAPEISILPDLRLRVTRRYDLLTDTPKTPAELAASVTLAWGVADVSYPTCLLVKQDIPSGENNNPAETPHKEPPTLIRVFEQIPAATEIGVGQADINIGQDGLTTVIQDFLQFSVAVAGVTPVYGVPGTTLAAAPWATLVLKTEERTDDGTLQRIKRTYISKGLIAQNDEAKNNGALLLRTLTYVNQVPPTPSGYTLITAKVDYPGGLPVYVSTFAKGLGEIDRAIEYSQSSDQGTTGVTRTTIRYMVAPGATVQPTTLAGSVLIGTDVAEQDGHRIWTTTWAKGAGTVSTTNETKDNGALLIRTIIALGSAPATPGGYTIFSAQVREDSGFQIFTSSFALGTGQLSQTDETKNDGALLIRTIRYLSVPGASNPIATPGGYTGTSITYEESDGHRVWTGSFALGTGQISQTDDTKYDGALLLRTIRYLSVPAASNPIATPSGYTAVAITYEEADGHKIWNGTFAKGTGQISLTIDYEVSADAGVTGITRQTIKYISTPSVVVNPITPPGGYVLVSTDRVDSDGFAIWTAMYATGTGVIASGRDIRENGLLVIYTKTSLNVAPTAPAATIGGTVVLVKDDQRNGTRIENGNIVYDRVWAEGNGQIATHIVTRQDGLREVTFISIGTRVAPTGVLIRDDVQTETGYNLYTVSAMQAADGVTAVTGVSFTFGSIEKWTYPGRLKPFVAITGAFKALDVYKSPPVTTDISASIVITYQTSGTLTLAHTLWSPTDAAAMYSQWVGTNGVQHNLVESYPGYRYVSGGTANLTATDNVHFSIFNQPIIAGNNATITAAGGPVNPDSNTYCLRAHLEPAFTDTAGTIYYRKTEVFATIPAQTALPV